MAGSSIPLTVRTPVLDIALGTSIDKAVVTGYGGLDAYGFHTLEALQCLVERRATSETGIAEVEWIEGEDVWRWYASDAGAWSKPLLAEALARHPKPTEGPVERVHPKTVLFRLKYRDGLDAAAFMLASGGSHWSVALQERGSGRMLSTMFGPAVRSRPLPHFDGLVYSIEEMFVTGKPQYPVERTLLTTGALCFLFESRRQRKPLATPELAVTYQAPKTAYFQRS
jgi:hypothetical protein